MPKFWVARVMIWRILFIDDTLNYFTCEKIV
jgi:hypothetical protein